MRKDLNKWDMICKLQRQPQYKERRYVFIFGIFKLVSYPSPGVWLGRENYKGFMYRIPLYNDRKYLKRKIK